MHTLVVIVMGLILLGLCTLVGHAMGGTSGTAAATLVFLPLWLVGAAISLVVGVWRAGYSFADEAPIFFVVFAIPAAIALLAWSKYH
jgi:hypothetical protein